MHQGAWCDSLLGLLFRGAQKAAAWDSPGWLPCGWVVEHRQRNQGAKRDPRTDSYLGFPLCSSVTAKLPSDWPDLLTFRLRQCPKLFAPAPVLLLSCSRLSSLSSFSQPESLQTHAPASRGKPQTIKARGEANTRKLRLTDTLVGREVCVERWAWKGTAFTLLQARALRLGSWQELQSPLQPSFLD